MTNNTQENMHTLEELRGRVERYQRQRNYDSPGLDRLLDDLLAALEKSD